ncbi:MAG TPA: beta-ketoacyl-[acyl-carrier-protein] synthase family protein [Planctomycetota bacterium]|nr:beta-ketoacyl-[acyl-carrier-protein] synthase family protein [Planctomycetota bacterium]
MSASPVRVVVTGLGYVSSLGFGPDEHEAALKEGRSSVGPIRRFETTGFRTSQGAQCDERRLEELLRRRWPGPVLRGLDVDTRMLLWSATEALDRAGVTPSSFSGPLPAVLGTTLEGFWQAEQWFAEAFKRTAVHARPRRLLQCMAGGQLATLADILGLTLEPMVISNACATGVSAIGRLFRRIRSGACELGLAGGYDTLTRFIHLGFDSLGALSPGRCMPFDKKRSGFFIGDAAAMLVLESLDSARRRGAPVHGEIVGYGESLDSHHPTHPDPDGKGIARAMTQALEMAAVAPDSVDYVNAHGTATPANDAAEARGILRALGDEVGRRVPVSSTKALVGHTLGAAGALEECFCLLALERGFLPVQAATTEPDPSCPLHLVSTPEGRPTIAINTSLGFGGANGVLVTRRWEAGS